jgi:hypothetical protein
MNSPRFGWSCEPAALGSEEDPAMGLSPPVQTAVDEAVRMIESLIAAARR